MNSKGSAEAVCGYKCGALPSCAPLAAAFVPAQENAQAQYEPDKALARGTLFPGLDLPFGNVVNDAAPNVPLAELMAIDFAAHDLSLYLDTHAGDAEAFAAYQDLLRLAEEGAQRYAKLYGPITKRDLLNAETYTWLIRCAPPTGRQSSAACWILTALSYLRKASAIPIPTLS